MTISFYTQYVTHLYKQIKFKSKLFKYEFLRKFFQIETKQNQTKNG